MIYPNSKRFLPIFKPDYSKMPLTFKGKAATNAVQLSAVSSPDAISLDYKKNNGVWTTYNVGDVIELSANQTVAFSGNNAQFSKDNGNYYQFIMTGTIESEGNVQSLLNYSNKIPVNWCFYRLFRGCNALKTPPSLFATTLAERCYDSMFNGTGLTAVPSLPATELKQICYRMMFSNCISLSSVPSDLLPATSLVSGCYWSMFSNCTSLTTAPTLSATTLASECYQGMFTNCQSLVTPPSLPATGLATSCYEAMFWGCTSLTDAPQLPATTLVTDCYKEMFQYCSKLSSINVGFTDWNWDNTFATAGWVLNVASTGVFTKPSNLSQDYGEDYIPVNTTTKWTIVNK